MSRRDEGDTRAAWCVGTLRSGPRWNRIVLLMLSAQPAIRMHGERLIVPLGALGFVGALALAQGGYWPTTWNTATIVLLAILVAGVVGLRRIEIGSFDRAVLLCFGVLTVWVTISTTWSLDPARSLLDAQRTLLYLCAVAVLVLVSPRGSQAGLLAAVGVACVAISVWSLATWHPGTPAPLGYSEAVGLVAAIGIILMLGWGVEGRPLALVGLAPLGATLYLAGSRAAVIALVVGLAVSVVLARGRAAARVALVVLVPVVALSASGQGSDSLRARLPMWEVAGYAAATHPVTGTGAGSFGRLWLRDRTRPLRYRDAHNLYLETFAEVGGVGLVVLLVALLTPVAAAVRARRRPLVPAAAGAYCAFLVHAGAHWDWELPAVTLIALTCGATLLVAARDAAIPHRVTRAMRAGLVGTALVLAALATVALAGNAAIVHSRQAIALGALSDASASARVAARWAPWSAEPWQILRHVALSDGNATTARADLGHALALDPSNWQLWQARARASRGAPRRAAQRHATDLNPLGEPGT